MSAESLLFQTLFGRGRDQQRFQLFSSSLFGENDLLFKDATQKLAVLPDDMDVSQVLGLDYVALLKGLGHEGADSAWCGCLTSCDFKSSLKFLGFFLVRRKFTGGQCCAVVLHQLCRAEEM